MDDTKDSSISDALKDDASKDGGRPDTHQVDVGAEVSLADSTISNDVQGDSSQDGNFVDGSEPEPEGSEFKIRKPIKIKRKCTHSSGGHEEEIQFEQTDYVCTYVYEGKKGEIYVQATPLECISSMFPIPKAYQLDKAQIKIDGKIKKLQDVIYDHGGRHHNDSLEFVYKGVHFTYDHSSFGRGWRACQPPDCAKVKKTPASAVEDGCKADRSKPIWCEKVQPDGTYDKSLKDKFKKCEGDPNTKGL